MAPLLLFLLDNFIPLFNVCDHKCKKGTYHYYYQKGGYSVPKKLFTAFTPTFFEWFKTDLSFPIYACYNLTGYLHLILWLLACVKKTARIQDVSPFSYF